MSQSREVSHSHQDPQLCVPSCPVWDVDDLEMRRATYRIDKDIQNMAVGWFTKREDWEGLRQYRAFQRAYPNRFPRR